MNHNKLEEFAKISVHIETVMSVMIKTQSLFVDLMLKECDIPTSMKDGIIKDMNEKIGIKLL